LGRYATHAFAHDFIKGTQVWLEAFAVMNGGWMILRKEQSLSEPNQIDQSIIVRDANFFKAVHDLAQFENERIGAGHAPLKTEAKRHFRTMAIATGIEFDTSGLPHPTINGQITGSGTFPADAYDRAEANHAARLKGLSGPIPESLKDEWQFLAQSRVYFSEIIALRAFIDCLKETTHYIGETLKGGGGMLSDFRSDFRDSGKLAKNADVSRRALEDIQRKADNFFASAQFKEAFDPEIHAWAAQALHQYTYYAYLALSGEAYHSLNTTYRQMPPSYMEECLEKAATSLVHLTGAEKSSAKEEVKRRAISMVTDFTQKKDIYRRFDAPPELALVTNWFHSLGDNLMERSGIKDPASTNGSGRPVPKPTILRH